MELNNRFLDHTITLKSVFNCLKLTNNNYHTTEKIKNSFNKLITTYKDNLQQLDIVSINFKQCMN